MSLIVRSEEPLDRATALEVDRLAFDSDEEPAIVEIVRDLEGSFARRRAGRRRGRPHPVQSSMGRAERGHRPRADRCLARGTGEGAGSALVRTGLEEAARRGEIAVILLGSPAYYPRFGFEPASSYGLSNPFAGIAEGDFVIAEEDFMLVPLDKRARRLAGPVRWHPSFGQVG